MSSESETTSQRRKLLEYPSGRFPLADSVDLRLVTPEPWWVHTTLAAGTLFVLWQLRFPGASIDTLVLSLLAMMIVALYWLIRLVLAVFVAVSMPVLRYSLRASWKRWLIMRAFIVFTFWSVWSQWPSRLAFALHRARMQTIALQVLNQPNAITGSQRVGLYDFDKIGLTTDGSAVFFHASVGNWGYSFHYHPNRNTGNIGGPWSAYSHD